MTSNIVIAYLHIITHLYHVCIALLHVTRALIYPHKTKIHTDTHTSKVFRGFSVFHSACHKSCRENPLRLVMCHSLLPVQLNPCFIWFISSFLFESNFKLIWLPVQMPVPVCRFCSILSIICIIMPSCLLLHLHWEFAITWRCDRLVWIYIIIIIVVIVIIIAKVRIVIFSRLHDKCKPFTIFENDKLENL